MSDSESALQNIDSLTIEEQDEMSDEFEEEMARFESVVANIRFDRLSDLAVSIHQKQNNCQPAPEPEDSQQNAVASSCKIIEPPLFGSYHILYVLEFDTGERWFCRVPCIGHREAWDDSAATSLRSEAFTMRLISRETTIPVPRVHYFDATLDNELGYPFTVMDYVEGINGQKSWFDRTIDIGLLEKHRERTLKDVAKAMQQLGRFTYHHCGAPNYDEDGNNTMIGPLRIPDADASLRKIHSDDDDDPPVFCEIGPFATAQEYLLSSFERRQPPQDEFTRGVFKLLRTFIEWLPTDTRTPPFVLMYDDPDIQNIIVREDGSLAAIIDWDGIAAVPGCVGN